MSLQRKDSIMRLRPRIAHHLGAGVDVGATLSPDAGVRFGCDRGRAGSHAHRSVVTLFCFLAIQVGATTLSPEGPQALADGLSVSNTPRISAGNSHSLALKADGSLWTFGVNINGELGTVTNNGTGNPNPTPTQVMTGISAVAAGGHHSLVLKADGSLWTFGGNYYGELGTATNSGTYTPNPTPTQVMTGVELT